MDIAAAAYGRGEVCPIYKLLKISQNLIEHDFFLRPQEASEPLSPIALISVVQRFLLSVWTDIRSLKALQQTSSLAAYQTFHRANETFA